MADGSFLLCNINIWWNFGVKNQESIATAFYANFEIRKYRHFALNVESSDLALKSRNGTF